MSNTCSVEANAIVLNNELAVLDTLDALGIQANGLNSLTLGSDGQGSLNLLVVNYESDGYVLINSLGILGLHVVARERKCNRSVHIPVAGLTLRCTELNSPLAIYNLELTAELSKENLIKNVSYIMALKDRLSAGTEYAVM